MKNMTRRGFLHGMLQSSLLLAGAPAGIALGKAAVGKGAKGTPRIVEVEGSPEKALAVLLDELGGIRRFVGPGTKVLLKPNMSFPNPPERATTTDPRLVRAMVLKCLEAGARRVVIADHPMRPSLLCTEKTGMRAACDGIKEAYLLAADKEDMYQKVSVEHGRELREIKILKALLDADVLINMPRMKSHTATTVSLGAKGNMGLIWDRSMFHVRMDLDQAIGDLNTYISADLTILDGTRVLTTGGPIGPGTVEDLNCIIGGTDPLAVDAYGAERVKWYGRSFSASQIAHLAACHQRGIGEIGVDHMDIQRRKVSGT